MSDRLTKLQIHRLVMGIVIWLACSPSQNLLAAEPRWTYPPVYVTPADKVPKFTVTDAQGGIRTLYSNSYAILILQGNYSAQSGFEPVSSVATQAGSLLRERLERRGFRVFIWKDLGSARLKDVLRDIFDDLGYDSNSRLFFYYFGHGHTVSDPADPTHDRTFLVPIDVPNPSVDETGFERAAFPITQMMQYAEQSTLKHTFFAFEACKAGAVLKKPPTLGGPAPPNPQGYILSAGILASVHQFLTAGNELQEVPADNSFTALVARALSDPEADANKDGYITGRELMTYVTTRLPQWKFYPLNPESGERPLGSTGDFIFGPVDPAQKNTAVAGSEAGVGEIEQNTRLEEAKRRQHEAITVVGDRSKSVLEHLEAINELGDIAKVAPELGEGIANQLALVALTFSSAHRADGPKSTVVGEISTESQAALKVLGQLPIMAKGLALQLQLGNFRGAKLSGAELNGVDLSGSDLTGSDLYGTFLYNANLPYAVLSGANLAGSLLSHAAFHSALFCEDHNTAVPALSRETTVPTQLSGAKLDEAHFDGAWLVGAILGNSSTAEKSDRTNLIGAHFNDADLQGADISYALLDGADLRGANLTDANLTGASVAGVLLDKRTRFCRTKWVEGENRSDGCPGEAGSRPSAHPICAKGMLWTDPRVAASAPKSAVPSPPMNLSIR